MVSRVSANMVGKVVLTKTTVGARVILKQIMGGLNMKVSNM